MRRKSIRGSGRAIDVLVCIGPSRVVRQRRAASTPVKPAAEILLKTKVVRLIKCCQLGPDVGIHLWIPLGKGMVDADEENDDEDEGAGQCIAVGERATPENGGNVEATKQDGTLYRFMSHSL